MSPRKRFADWCEKISVGLFLGGLAAPLNAIFKNENVDFPGVASVFVTLLLSILLLYISVRLSDTKA